MDCILLHFLAKGDKIMRRRTIDMTFIKLTTLFLFLLSLMTLGCDGGDSKPRFAQIAVGEERIAYDKAGNEYRILPKEHKIVRLDNNGSTLWEAGGLGEGESQLNYPIGILTDADDNLYVIDLGNSRIVVFDNNGNYLRQIGTQGIGDENLNFMRDAVISDDGYIYVTDTINDRIQVFDLQGNPIRRFGYFGLEGEAIDHPESLAIDPNGYIHVADSGNALHERRDIYQIVWFIRIRTKTRTVP
jgi:DNA-binding beta-propeller fold protein YncE